MVVKYVVAKEYDGQNLHTVLKKQIGLSSRMIAKLKRVENGMTIDGKLIRTIDSVKVGQEVVLKMPEEPIYVEGMPLSLEIVYEDDFLLVVNKPPFLAMHPSAGKTNPTLANAVISHYESEGEGHAFHPVNRLDKNTSGLVLVAKDAHTTYALQGKSEKRYVAIVNGVLEGEGVINQPIKVKEGSCITRDIGPEGKESITHWKSLWHDEEMSLLSLELETGRTHQIRVHMAWLGHPLLGDTMYGEMSPLLNRQALHCEYLKIYHPQKQQCMEWRIPLSEDMQTVLQQRGFKEKIE